MNIILLQNIDKVGGKFEVVSVKNGYARNYLIPQKKALIANDTNMRRLEDYRRREAARLAKSLDEYKVIAAKLNDSLLKIGAKAGTSGKIFGSVTNIQLAQALLDQLEVEVDRKIIDIPEVKTLGTYTATVNLHPEVESTIKFEVVEE
ncbi:MAG: 50S ribosomal protein L9 [Bacteroidetes bacterium]|jgi:large subunit ribosomal protein L9|nr:50S ribosomal protein L9 [Bacteroidota bacterium]MDF1866317.1 50S ribosomal protein L9 [Saprospiraceae bacterium]